MPTRYQQMKYVTIIGGIVDLLLGLLKIAFGIFGHSQALFADGVHSLSDLATDAMVIVASKSSTQLPDEAHPYGHGRIETIFAAILAIILFAVGIGILFDAIHEILHQHFLKPSMSVLFVAAVSILLNEFLFRYTLRTAELLNSNLLRANAWHKRSDALASIVVLIGISGEMMGFHYFDAAAAIVVALMIIKMSFTMIWSNVRELIETGVDKKTLQALRKVIENTLGVQACHQLRTRLIGGQILIDVHVQLDPYLSLSEAHFIADHVEKNLMQYSHRIADVVVHMDPEDDDKLISVLNLPNRKTLEKTLKKRWAKLPGYQDIQKMNLHYLKGKIEIEIILPLKYAREPPQKIIQPYQEAVKNIPNIRSVKVYFDETFGV
ncbi:MAG: cation transporter [Gammaproteobacteria bacterium]|nr:cation transporter [Gammaproteobacteria bacterium]